MNVTDLLSQAGGLQSIARELGVTEQQASSGAAALVPAILGGFIVSIWDFDVLIYTMITTATLSLGIILFYSSIAKTIGTTKTL